MIKIILDGRKDVEDYFKLSGVFDGERLTQTPLLAFISSDDAVTVRIIHRSDELLTLDDETPVMGQWRGEWRSDFFQFNAGQYRQFAEAKLEPLKSAKEVVKTVGPQGGFRSLAYEYMNDRGAIIHVTASTKAEADRLEAFFVRHGIPIEIKKAR